jgi:hypothetical protein
MGMILGESLSRAPAPAASLLGKPLCVVVPRTATPRDRRSSALHGGGTALVHAKVLNESAVAEGLRSRDQHGGLRGRREHVNLRLSLRR